MPQVDYLRTCVRPPWQDLPEAVRAAVGEVAGSPVVDGGTPVGSGFTGGFAAVVGLADGRSVFAKAGSGTNPHLLEAYATEAGVLAALPAAAPAPALVGSRHLPAGAADDAWCWTGSAPAAAGPDPPRHPRSVSPGRGTPGVSRLGLTLGVQGGRVSAGRG